jgi:hypothetical protein
MSSDPEEPQKLLSVVSEIEAAAIVTALAEYDIEAFAVGGYTSGFRAEAPGEVSVMVKRADVERSIRALDEIRGQEDQIDWANVNWAENAESEESAAGLPSVRPDWAASLVRILCLFCLVGLATSLIVWLFVRNRELLMKFILNFVLLGIALGLPSLAIAA